MKNQKGNVAIVLIIVVLIAGGWYFLTQNNTIVDDSTVRQTPLNAMQSNTSIPTGWMTYNDIKYNFKFVYPNGYTVRKNYDSKCATVIAWSDGYFENDAQRKIFLENNKIVDFTAIVNDPNDKCVESHYSSPAGEGAKKLINSKEVVVNGNKVLQRDYVDVLSGVQGKAFQFSTFRFQSGNVYITLLINNGVTSDPGTVDNKKTLDMFVKSFSFLK